MGFDFDDRKNKHDWETVRLALQAHKSIHGHFQVPFLFRVPHGDRHWPEQTWGMKLGNVISNIRTKGYYPKHHDELRAMGFDLRKQRNRSCGKKPKL
jgi:Helicase associated domain